MNEILIHLDEAAPISVTGDEIERTGEDYLEIRAAGELVAVFAPGCWMGAAMVQRVSLDGDDVVTGSPPDFRLLMDMMADPKPSADPKPDTLPSRAQMITDIRRNRLDHMPHLETTSPDSLLRIWNGLPPGARSAKSTPESLGSAEAEG